PLVLEQRLTRPHFAPTSELNELPGPEPLQIGVPTRPLVPRRLVDGLAPDGVREALEQGLQHLSLPFRQPIQPVLLQSSPGWERLEIGAQGLDSFRRRHDLVAGLLDEAAAPEPLDIGVPAGALIT